MFFIWNRKIDKQGIEKIEYFIAIAIKRLQTYGVAELL